MMLAHHASDLTEHLTEENHPVIRQPLPDPFFDEFFKFFINFSVLSVQIQTQSCEWFPFLKNILYFFSLACDRKKNDV